MIGGMTVIPISAAKVAHANLIKAGLNFSVYAVNNIINHYVKVGFSSDAYRVFDEMPVKNVVSWNSVISMHAKSGRIAEAVELFERMPERDSVSWTALIVGHSRIGSFEYAVKMFVDMISDGFVPSHFTFSNVISSCASLRWIKIGKKVHSFVVKMGMSGYVEISNSLLNMYGKSRNLEMARVIFEKMSYKEISSWNTMISTYMQTGKIDSALELFEKMEDCNTISWNAVIAGYNQNGLDFEALKLFLKMMELNSVKPDSFTFTNVLSACANLGMLKHGKQVHAHIVRIGVAIQGPLGNALISMYSKSGAVEMACLVADKTMTFDLNVVSFTALLEGYVKHGNLEPARKIFNSMKFPDVVAWTAMIVGYVQNGCHSDGISLFRKMIRYGPEPNNYTLAAMLSISSTLAAINHGKQIHAKAVKSEEGLSISVGNALITMYAKSGDISASRKVFELIRSSRQTVSWTSMVIALAQHGHGNEAVDLFEEMLHLGIKPDHITYVGVISACTHVRMVEEGRKYFEKMQKMHMIEPTSSHYACMIDLFGRAGLLNEALEFAENMPIEPDAIAWGSLLAACRIHKNAGLAKMAAEKLLLIEPDNSGAYSALANMYSACGAWEEASKVWKSMRTNGVKKEQGISWIQIKDLIHVFGAEDNLHQEREKIYEMAAKIWKEIKKAGFVPDISSVLHDVDDELKEQLLCHHSEKMAIAYGLIVTTEKTTLRIMKNLRVCNDCHSAIKYISQIYQREIIVRDVTRFHHFRDGYCSCKDYW